MNNQVNEPDRIQFFDCFSWAVPTAFASELAKCRFERGDILYDTRKGYLQWDEALKHLNYSLHVKAPPQGVSMPTEDCSPMAQLEVFRYNWASQIRFVATNYKTKETRDITSTQGRFYNLLWKGDWNELDSHKDPAVPYTCLNNEIYKLAKKAAYRILAKHCAQVANPNLFVVPFDPTNSTAVTKCENLRKGLGEHFQVHEQSFAPDAVGLRDTLIVPTVGFIAFTIDCEVQSRLFAVLRKILYKGASNGETEGDNFNINVHGAYLPFRKERETAILS